VKEIVSKLPSAAETAGKRPIIERIHSRLSKLPEHVPPIPVVPPEDLDRALAQLQQFMVMAQNRDQAEGFERIRRLVQSLPKQEYYRRLSAFQQSMAADLLGRMYTLRAVSNPEPPQLTDLPEGLVARFVGKSGYYSMQICTKADIWNMDAMEKFVKQLRSVDASVTGNPVQIFESSREMKWGYEKGAIYGVVIVLLVVWLDFRNLRMTMLALIPLLASKLQLFGLMGLLDIPLNPANMIVLPLILGIGVDNGVHIIHDYLQGPTPYRMNASTGAAIVINTLQNIVGFGGLMIATHRGLHSLGRVLTLGMACCLLSALVMPSLLQILPDMRPKKSSKEDESPTDDDIRYDAADDSLRPRSSSYGSTPRRRASA
jgi:predicted RND superfamily exporter protein